MIQINTSFHDGLQVAWDSTSIGNAKTCWRYYYYFNVLGIVSRQTSAHLLFGLWYHAALERYDHARAAGKSFDEAVCVATRYALTCTWDTKLDRAWVSDVPEKSRATLVRSVIWYLEQFEHDPYETIVLADGKPAVELSFRFDTSYSSPFAGIKYSLSGHFDRMAALYGDTNDAYIMDRKSTKSAFSEYFWKQFTPHNQFTLYTIAGKVVYKTNVKGLIVDAVQVGAGFSRFARRPISRDDGQLEEWYTDFGALLATNEMYHERKYYPQNDKACQNYGGCPYHEICKMTPKAREQWQDKIYVKRIWDPLIARGDI